MTKVMIVLTVAFALMLGYYWLISIFDGNIQAQKTAMVFIPAFFAFLAFGLSIATLVTNHGK